MLKKKEKSIKSTVGEERPKTFHLAISRDETILLFIVIFGFFPNRFLNFCGIIFLQKWEIQLIQLHLLSLTQNEKTIRWLLDWMTRSRLNCGREKLKKKLPIVKKCFYLFFLFRLRAGGRACFI